MSELIHASPRGQTLLLRSSGPSRDELIQKAAAFTHVVVADRAVPAGLEVGVDFLPVCSFEPATVAAAWVAEARPTPRACFTSVDPLIPAAAEAGALLGVSGFDPAAVREIKDKWLFRRKLREAGFAQPDFCEVSFGGNVKIPFPCVLKPREGAYGLGVSIVSTARELQEYWKRCEHELEHGKWAGYLNIARRGWLAEALLQGVDVSVEVLGGRQPRVLEIHEKTVTKADGRHFSEDRFVTAPWCLHAEEVDGLRPLAESICAALGFSHGVGNLEGCLTPEGFRPIELQLCPTGGLVSDMVWQSRGIDLAEWHARSYLNEAFPEVTSCGGKCAMEVLHAPHPGVWTLNGTEECADSPGVLKAMFLEHETTVAVPHADYAGFVMTSAPTSALAVQLLEGALARLSWCLLRQLT